MLHPEVDDPGLPLGGRGPTQLAVGVGEVPPRDLLVRGSEDTEVAVWAMGEVALGAIVRYCGSILIFLGGGAVIEVLESCLRYLLLPNSSSRMSKIFLSSRLWPKVLLADNAPITYSS